ncbi:hypothetical protein [Actinacidiphila acididurans]|uniref:DUF202 domain-containing protein n=1 Tax=Actinacidiphila acididurans TaxID=2784346 RepID=A0ABS2U0L5_9ACTN|nr:hypothetical protein [Actinacidiphila acididurans]MBM9509130.1 hypothetical protein [Actinacidiphila acididurans]
MTQRLRTLGSGVLTCLALVRFGYQALNDGMLRVLSVVLLCVGTLTTAASVRDRFRPRPQRRRSRERGAGR